MRQNLFEHLAIERGVDYLDAVLIHYFLELTVAARISHLPADRPQDDIPFKMTALELDHRPLTR